MRQLFTFVHSLARALLLSYCLHSVRNDLMGMTRLCCCFSTYRSTQRTFHFSLRTILLISDFHIYFDTHAPNFKCDFFQSFSSKMNFICIQCIVNLIHYIALPESLHSTFASQNNVRINKITNFHINVSYNELIINDICN